MAAFLLAGGLSGCHPSVDEFCQAIPVFEGQMRGHYSQIQAGNFQSHQDLVDWAGHSLEKLSQVQVAVEHNHKWMHLEQAMNNVLFELGSIYYAGENRKDGLILQSFGRMEKSLKDLHSRGCAQLLPAKSAGTLVGSSF